MTFLSTTANSDHSRASHQEGTGRTHLAGVHPTASILPRRCSDQGIIWHQESPQDGTLLRHECIPLTHPCPAAHPMGMYLSLTSSSLEKGTGEKSNLMHFVLDIQGFGTHKAAHTFLVFNETFDSTPKRKWRFSFILKSISEARTVSSFNFSTLIFAEITMRTVSDGSVKPRPQGKQSSFPRCIGHPISKASYPVWGGCWTSPHWHPGCRCREGT